MKLCELTTEALCRGIVEIESTIGPHATTLPLLRAELARREEAQARKGSMTWLPSFSQGPVEVEP